MNKRNRKRKNKKNKKFIKVTFTVFFLSVCALFSFYFANRHVNETVTVSNDTNGLIAKTDGNESSSNENESVVDESLNKENQEDVELIGDYENIEFITYYADENTEPEVDEIAVPSNLKDVNINEITEYFPDTTITSKVGNKITLTKNVEFEPYYLTTYVEDEIVTYLYESPEQKTVFDKTYVSADELNEYDKVLLLSGIKSYSEEEVFSIFENFEN